MSHIGRTRYIAELRDWIFRSKTMALIIGIYCIDNNYVTKILILMLIHTIYTGLVLISGRSMIAQLSNNPNNYIIASM